MKRLLSVILVLTMLFSCTVAFSSCSKVGEKSFEEDAQGVIKDSLKTAYGAFFADESGMGEMASAAFRGGMMHLSLESETLLGEIDKIEETVYFDEETGRYVSDTAVTYAGETLSLRAELLDKVLTLSGETVFGSTQAYAVNFATMLADMDGSHLLAFLGMTSEAIAELKDQLSSLTDVLEENALTEAEEVALVNEMLALLRPTLAAEELDGQDCITVTYTIDNDTVYAAAKKWIEGTVKDETKRAEELASLDENVANADTNILYTLKLSVAKKSGALVRAELSGSENSLDEEYPESTTMQMTLTVGETEISLSGSEKTSAWYQIEDKTTAYAVKLTKEVGESETKYVFSMSETEDEETKTPLSFTYTYAKETGAFTLALNALDEETEEVNSISVAGKLIVDETSATLQLDSITSGEVTLAVKFSLSFRKDAEMPAAASGKNILTLTEEETEKFLTDFSESKLAQLLGDITE